ncbi:MAG: hypothetical protein AB7O57_07260 [Hyphomicrobiaceae bacterium]
MAEPRFADDDDLPRTLRREREAREREMRERELPPIEDGYGAGPQQGAAMPVYAYDYAGDGTVTVTRLKLPFLHLTLFFMKAVIAAIPALILLTVMLWGLGQGLKHLYPQLRHLEIVVRSTQ